MEVKGEVMEVQDNRLIDEARREPVKNAFRLGLEFMDRNRMLAAMTMGAFVLLSLLEVVPLVGMLAGIALSVAVQGVQIYVGRTFYVSSDIEQYVSFAESAKIKTFLTQYAAPAFGAWLGWFVLSFIFIVAFLILAVMAGVDPSMLNENAMQDEAKVAELGISLLLAGLPLLVIGMVLTYVYPIAQGRVILSDTVADAFKAVFSIFTPSVWSAALQKEYFSYVFFFSLAIIGISLLIMLTMVLLFMIPVLGFILAMVWLVFLMYVFTLILGVANTMAREIAEGGRR